MDVMSTLNEVKALKTLILRSRYMAARLANAEMLKLYFAIGAYVSKNTREGKWGTGAIDEVSRLLSVELPGLKGFSAANIKNMRSFFEEWAFCQIRQSLPSELQSWDYPIRQAVAGELSENDLPVFMSIGFTHHMEILRACHTLEERLFYIRRCAQEFWSYRVLQQHIKAHDYETEGQIVNNFALTMPDDKQVSRAVQAFRSEYLLDFVNIVDLNETEEERDEPEWMMDMVAKVKDLVQALGSDFCFMNVKKRFVVGESEFFTDLVFYHRTLKCMVAVELKKGAFKPAYLGQLDFYLACLDKYVKHEDENPSIGLLLCRSMDRPVVELAVRRYSMPLGVATYRTEKDVPEEYKVLTPIMEGARRLLAESSALMDEGDGNK